MVEKYQNKDRELFFAIMNLEMAYDRVDRKGLWDALRIYGVGGHLLDGIRPFYQDASASCACEQEAEKEF